MKCIDCEFAVMSVKNPVMCKCWKVEPDKRELINAQINRECWNFKLGAMDNVRIRIGWKA